MHHMGGRLHWERRLTTQLTKSQYYIDSYILIHIGINRQNRGQNIAYKSIIRKRQKAVYKSVCSLLKMRCTFSLDFDFQRPSK